MMLAAKRRKRLPDDRRVVVIDEEEDDDDYSGVVTVPKSVEDGKLTDEGVKIYIRRMQNCRYSAACQFAVFDCYAFEIMKKLYARRSDENAVDKTLTVLLRTQQNQDVTTKRFVLIPYNILQCHWTLLVAVFNPSGSGCGTFYAMFDSLGVCRGRKFIAEIMRATFNAIIRRRGGAKDDPAYVPTERMVHAVPVLHQTDGVSCGFHMLATMEALLSYGDFGANVTDIDLADACTAVTRTRVNEIVKYLKRDDAAKEV